MMKEWLEEKLGEALEREDAYKIQIHQQDLKIHDKETEILKLVLRIEELKVILESLLPIDEDGDCVMCQDELPNDNIHTDGSLCLEHPYYTKALEVLDAD